MADEGRRAADADDGASLAARAIQAGATVLLGGGFYFGFVRQQRLARREKLVPKRGAKASAPPVIRQATAMERWLRLDRPQSPGIAAFKALLGGTVMSVSGCALLVFGASTLLGINSADELRQRVEQALPRNRAPPRLLPSEQRTTEFASEEEELNHIAKIFEEAVAEELRDQRKAKK